MSYVHSGSVLFQKQRVLCAEHAQTKSAPKPLQNTLHGKRALGSGTDGDNDTLNMMSMRHDLVLDSVSDTETVPGKYYTVWQ